MFDGATFDYSRDFHRLKTALDRVAHYMADGVPRTLAEIAAAAQCTEAAASARLRDLRKEKWARYYQVLGVDSECVGGGLWLYRVRVGKPKQQQWSLFNA